ncbi:putative protein EFR3 [Glarea lozoyensis 74030]|uniref:Protein EFR3 n=1 Tax=Glarea lozoyensis (strain ATCC 74030 / MF5533) TaxID=1104152 RepID=H0EKH9_GLAL7|nr:putative protein EFR3 [Glarea lozoyensis 74030]
MNAIRQKCRPKHQVLILKCYPRTTKGAVDVKPNSSELSYLLYYATTRRSKVQKVGAFLEKKTASDVWRARIGNVQVTLQILAGLIEKAPRDLPLYAPYVLKILNIILSSRDITMVESSIPTFEAFCEHYDGASLSTDQEYLQQYEEIVKIYASFASTRPPQTKSPMTAPLAIRWRNVGLQAIKSVASSEALASIAGRQIDVIVPMLLENLWTGDEDFVEMLEQRAEQEVKTDTEKAMLRRRTSAATVRTVDTVGNPGGTVSATTAEADKLAEENIGVLAMQCLQKIFVVPNRSQIHGATTATLGFITERVAQNGQVLDEKPQRDSHGGWAPKIFEKIARWTPVQDRYVILVTAMEVLVRSPVLEEHLPTQLLLATMIDSLLKSDINLIGLSVMDVLLSLIHHIVKLLQLSGGSPSRHASLPVQGEIQQGNGGLESSGISTPSPLRKELLSRLQACVGDLATHVYYADQISDMVSAVLMRLKPSPSTAATTIASIENPNPGNLGAVGDLLDSTKTDGFFLFGTAKVKALEAIKAILFVASHRKTVIGGASLGRNSVPLKVWEGTQWLLRDSDGRVRKAYVDALSTWLDTETTKSDLKVKVEKHRLSSKPGHNSSSVNLTKRAVSNASQKEKQPKVASTTFLELLHLAVYDNALQFSESESDYVLLHLLLANLIRNLGVNAVASGLPMIYRLQEDILEAETPIAKIRMGSLCHGYFWILSERFDFDTSPVGRVLHNEINRRRSKSFWVERIRMPPIGLHKITTPGTASPERPLPTHNIESESLTPFDDRFQMVKLISLSYADSLASAPTSPPTSPGRSFSHPILSTGPAVTENVELPEKVKDQMMAEWSREAVIALVQEGSKSVSITGSRSGTQATGHRNFLAVNGMSNSGGTNSRNQSPPGGVTSHHSHRGKADSSYGLVGELGALAKLRKGSGLRLCGRSLSSFNSVTRVDQLKRVLSGQVEAPPVTRKGMAHSDASSESMVSYDFTASELSYNPSPNHQNISYMERSASLRGPNGRPRSKSRDHVAAQGEHQRPLTSNPSTGRSEPFIHLDGENFDTVPPVPPLPSSLTGKTTAVQDHAFHDPPKSLHTKDREASFGSAIWGDEATAVDLERVLKGIDTEGMAKGDVVGSPPY